MKLLAAVMIGLVLLIGAGYAYLARNPLVIMPDLSMLPAEAIPNIHDGIYFYARVAVEYSENPPFILTFKPLVKAFDMSVYSSPLREQIGGGIFDGYCTEMSGLGYSRRLLIARHRERGTNNYRWNISGTDAASQCAACGVC